MLLHLGITVSSRERLGRKTTAAQYSSGAEQVKTSLVFVNNHTSHVALRDYTETGMSFAGRNGQ